MMAKCVTMVALGAIFLVFLSCTQSTLGAQYQVGGAQGWDLGIDYQAWASSITFKQGDTLYFKYEAKMHSVLQVSEEDYSTCNTRAPITSDGGQGKTLVQLESGTYYFICGVPGHCMDRMKLAVPVQAAGSATPSTSSSSPSSTPPTTPSPSNYTPSTYPNLPLAIALLLAAAVKTIAL